MLYFKVGFKVSVVIVSASLAAGCGPGKYAGGGQIALANPDSFQNASFGFTVKAEDKDRDGTVDSVKGQFQYHDHGADTAFHGIVIDGGQSPINVGTLNPDGNLVFTEAIGLLSGIYFPQPANLGPGGQFEVVVFFWPEDSGLEDEVRVSLSGGVYDGYLNWQAIDHGKVSILPIE